MIHEVSTTSLAGMIYARRLTDEMKKALDLFIQAGGFCKCSAHQILDKPCLPVQFVLRDAEFIAGDSADADPNPVVSHIPSVFVALGCDVLTQLAERVDLSPVLVRNADVEFSLNAFDVRGRIQAVGEESVDDDEKPSRCATQ
jgi:hypothetical protein